MKELCRGDKTSWENSLFGNEDWSTYDAPKVYRSYIGRTRNLKCLRSKQSMDIDMGLDWDGCHLQVEGETRKGARCRNS